MSPSAPTIRDLAADVLLARGVEIAVVKLGGDGVLVATADERTVVPPRPVEVVCGLGAGDAFGGAFVHGLLAGWPPARIVEYANAAGAIVAGRLLCADAMPTESEITDMLQHTGDVVVSASLRRRLRRPHHDAGRCPRTHRQGARRPSSAPAR